VIINVAKQEHRKGLTTLIDAVALLAPRRPRLVLLHAGLVGHATDELQHQIDNQRLRERVRMLGYRSDVPDLLAAADVFVFPSLYEGLGGSVIEAMALSLPIVASDTPALQEMLEPGRNALLVPPLRAPELADAVAQLFDDPATRHAFASRSREIFEDKFTLERSAARMLDLYTRVVDDHRSKRRGRRVPA
jgi:glycosyltransferase involved in cell wall biosynthesis